MGRASTVSRILRAAKSGESIDHEALFPLVYEELKCIAASKMSDERKNHTLQPTALVHEAYLRLSAEEPLDCSCRAEFYFAAARAMRRILIEHARAKGSRKRGGDWNRRPNNLADVAVRADPEIIVALDEAIVRLEEEEPRAAKVVSLRFYAGLSIDDAAEVLRLSRRTVRREWTYARIRLFRLLGGNRRE
jgi:RNA polymerase sigma factor (TIGR02999 family)